MRMTEQGWGILQALSNGCPARRGVILTRMLADACTDETLRKMRGSRVRPQTVDSGLKRQTAIRTDAIPNEGYWIDSQADALPRNLYCATQ